MTRPRLDPARQTWMQAPETVAVMEALDAARPGGSRFVGGCVRNALLGEPVADIDIATPMAYPSRSRRCGAMYRPTAGGRW